MNNNMKFINKLDERTRSEILANIARHYGISRSEVLEELADNEAEHLLDYMTGPERMAASALMQKHGL